MRKVILRALLSIILAAPVGVGVFALAADNNPSRGPLRLEIAPVKQIYSNREGLLVQFRLTALSRTKVCMDKDILSQMQVGIFRSGSKLPLQPLVITDNSQRFRTPLQVRWLEPGESVVLRANLKRYRFAEGLQWEPGEYSAKATFNLCEQTPIEHVTDPGREIPVQADKPGWFMIMI